MKTSKGKAIIKMKKSSFIKEHKHLPKVLEHGSKASREKEAEEQEEELEKVLKK